MLFFGIYIFLLGVVWMLFILKKLSIRDIEQLNPKIKSVSIITLIFLAVFSVIGVIIVGLKTNILNQYYIDQNSEVNRVYY